jgi:protein-tyrosine phosphatase
MIQSGKEDFLEPCPFSPKNLKEKRGPRPVPHEYQGTATMIDIHCHILPNLDDGADTWDEALRMARMAVADGIREIVATPHLFRHKIVDPKMLNPKEKIFKAVFKLKQKLVDAGVELNVYPGCDVPLCPEIWRLVRQGQVLTINDTQRYLLLEMPDTAIPPATEELCFQLASKGITPIITHPERNLVFYEMPNKLVRLLDLGCLAQLTAQSLTGRFGRHVAKFARLLVSKGYVQVMATDAHNSRSRPPLLLEAVREISRIIGESRAWDMVTAVPEKIICGDHLA